MVFRGVVAGMAGALLLAGNLLAAGTEFTGRGFEAWVIKANGKRYREFSESRGTVLKVKPNEEYSILVRNPLPVRVAVAVTIDGLNSIDGKRTSPRNAQKWMIEPNSTLTVAGWQTGRKTLRKFLFTDQSNTLAQWREERDGKMFTRNLGVIGVAWFWNSGELEAALRPPQPFVEDRSAEADYALRDRKASMAPAAAGAPAARAEAKAGTGMGRQEHNHVTEVEFNANAGMFAVKDVLKIYYEFAKEPAEPLPFVEEDEDEGRFTPDMRR